MSRFLRTLFLSCGLFFSTAHAAEIAIIIDDIGYKKSDYEVLDLPNEVTISVLPHTPHGKKIARQAAMNGREIMLHIPMESLSGLKLGPGGLLGDMSEQVLRNELARSIAALPHIVGVNNHMGSKLTQMHKPMQIIMRQLKQHDLYFVDSRTTRFTLAETVAKEEGVKHWRRNIFLDSEQNENFVRQQFKQLLRTAERKGFAVAIGHPYPETIKVLKEEFAKLNQKYTIARVSRLPDLALTERYAYTPSKQQQVIAN